MTPDALIETYVADVVRRLPRRQRADVAFELRSLLREEVAGRAADDGRVADDTMTLALLTEFGAPADVADRYRPAGFTIIRPADAPRFARIAFIGVGVQWVLSLIAVSTTPLPAGSPGSDGLSRLGTWWLSWGIGSFWWPGFLICLTIIAAWVGSRRSATPQPAPVSVIDRDRVNRPVTILYAGLAMVGIAVLIAVVRLAEWAPGLPAPVLDALAIDPEFIASRAPWVLLLWAATGALALATLIAGRWTRTTRLVGVALDLAWIALLLWWVLAGPIFVTEAADTTARGLLFLLIVFPVVDAVLTLRRVTRPIPVPAS
jgi:hypothetical protein